MLRDVGPAPSADFADELATLQRTILVLSADRVQRLELVTAATEGTDAAVLTASSYFQAVPLVWERCPDVLLVGSLTRDDRQRLPELRSHCPDARVIAVVPDDRGAQAEYAALGPDVHLVTAAPAEPLADLLTG